MTGFRTPVPRLAEASRPVESSPRQRGSSEAGSLQDSRLRGNDTGKSSPRKPPAARRGSCNIGANRRAGGFTLLEVMIALLVIVVGTAAVINTSTESTWKSAQLWQRTVAGWVAQNQIAEFRARRSWGNDRRLSGKTEMANTEWQWEMTISGTDDPSLRRLDIEVFLEDQEGAKASLTAFVARL